MIARIAFMAFTLLAAAPPTLQQSLLGSWDSTSYTSMQNGHIVGKLALKPQSMVFIFHNDASWQMHAAEATNSEHHGRYQLHGNELIMKEADGSTYQDFKIELLNEGKQMSMTDADVVLQLSRLADTPAK